MQEVPYLADSYCLVLMSVSFSLKSPLSPGFTSCCTAFLSFCRLQIMLSDSAVGKRRDKEKNRSTGRKLEDSSNKGS